MVKLMEQRIFAILFVCVFLSCTESNKKNEYFTDLGNISRDDLIDDVNYEVCHEDFTVPFNYLGVGLIYKGEKPALVKEIKSKYEAFEKKGESGFITVRFIINCKGKAGRFRLSETDIDLKPKKFDKKISTQILKITKELEGWKPFYRESTAFDYQQYLVFKINEGILEKILP
jgi:hypothetical protein